MFNYIRTLLIILIAGFASAILMAYGNFFAQDSISATTLQNAIQVSTLAANDKSARSSRGVFVINLKKFQDQLARTQVQSFGGKKPTYHISILKDDQAHIDSNAQGQYSTNYNTIINSNGHKQNLGLANTTNQYMPIKAIRVQADFKDSKKVNNSPKHANEQVATYVIQNTTASDAHNDLTAN